MDLVTQAAELAAAIEKFVQSPPTKLAPKVAETLLAIHGRAVGVHNALAELSQYMVLEIEEETHYLNNRFVDDDTGYFEGPRAAQLAQASECLGPLYRGGVDFKTIRRFTQNEVGVARWLGDDFNEIATTWMPFRGQLSKGLSRLEWQGKSADAPEAVSQLMRFLGGLKRHEIISGFDSFFYSFGSQKWVSKPLKDIIRMQNVQRFAVEWTLSESGASLARLVTGDWLTAYVYELCTDHLVRNGQSFEAYTLVKYRAPPDIVRLATDFDLVVSTAKRTMLVECKTGKLTDELLQEVQYKAVCLLQAMQKAGVRREHSNWLVINPALSPVVEVQSRMDHLAEVTRETAGINLRITVLEPSMIRMQLTSDFAG
jgi:hypothetical protein